jgi:acyl carrier protein/GNAT superfamily N-acetyltransferase
VTHAHLEKEVVSVLRRVALGGSDREIRSSDPLGEFGLGLDSLALIGFITALENRFGIDIPETIWVDRGQLTLQDLVDLIAESVDKHDFPAPPQNFEPVPIDPTTTESTAWGKLKAIAEQKGLFSALFWAMGKARRKCLNLFYQKDRFYILSFDLTGQAIPTIPAPQGTRSGEVTPDDLPATEGLWSPGAAAEKKRLFLQRLKDGYTGYATWLDGQIVGLCWVTRDGDFEPDTGLHIRLREHSSYGLDLNEHPGYPGQGIGLATIAYSLRQSQATGHKYQYSVVHSHNERMLRASIQLLGLKKIGEIVTARNLFGVSSVYEMNDKTDDNKVLML